MTRPSILYTSKAVEYPQDVLYPVGLAFIEQGGINNSLYVNNPLHAFRLKFVKKFVHLYILPDL